MRNPPDVRSTRSALSRNGASCPGREPGGPTTRQARAPHSGRRCATPSARSRPTEAGAVRRGRQATRPCSSPRLERIAPRGPAWSGREGRSVDGAVIPARRTHRVLRHTSPGSPRLPNLGTAQRDPSSQWAARDSNTPAQSVFCDGSATGSATTRARAVSSGGIELVMLRGARSTTAKPNIAGRSSWASVEECLSERYGSG